MTKRNPPPVNKGRNLAFGAFGLFALACAAGTSLGFEAHSPFLFGLGDLDAATTMGLPWVTHNEPVNALSIPTWGIHFSSVIEYVFAMSLVWQYSKVTNNPTWKGLTWGMLPLHASGFCACTYHFFYNPSSLQFLVTMQAAFTLLGNLTCALAAYRIAASNGWTLEEVNPFPRSSTSPQGLVADGIAATPLQLLPADTFGSTQALTAKLVGLTLVCSYLVKYGELGLDLPFTPNTPVAVLMVLGVPAITAYNYYSLSSKEDGGGLSNPLSFLGFGGMEDGKPALSMDDVKKYGVAGTVAYVLTELAFWVVAFPVAAYALYQSTGHWPDVVNDNTDRAAVLAFIFAGANVARAFVPIRLGAALASAPWVDENILSKMEGGRPAASDGQSE
jgi:hypothetical protein